MSFRTSTIQSLSAVTEPTALSSKNFMLLSKIDTYNGDADPAYQVYRISEGVLLHGYKPTIVDVAEMSSVVKGIYADFKDLSGRMQDRGTVENKTGMMHELTGYMLNSEVANDLGKMIRQEDVGDITDKFVDNNEVSAVAAELYATAEDLAQEAMDYAGALGMALVTAHAPVGADEDEEDPLTPTDNNSGNG